MGQQQLILLVLATVIVGLATVVGIQAFTENKAKSTQDAIVQDLVRMASDAQAWKQKPSPFGGQGLKTDGSAYGKADFTNLANLGLIGYPVDGTGVYRNLNGEFQITTAGGASGVAITGQNCEQGVRATVTVDGIQDVDIESEVVSGLVEGTDCTAGTIAAVGA